MDDTTKGKHQRLILWRLYVRAFRTAEYKISHITHTLHPQLMLIDSPQTLYSTEIFIGLGLIVSGGRTCLLILESDHEAAYRLRLFHL